SDQQMQKKEETYAKDDQLNTSNEHVESSTNIQDKMCGHSISVQDVKISNNLHDTKLEPKRPSAIRVRKARDITRAKKYRKAKERSLHYQYFDMADMGPKIYHGTYEHVPGYVLYNPNGGVYALEARWKSALSTQFCTISLRDKSQERKWCK
ncbi:hypothetical protein ACJMK2_033584, partial [Sinanodonta woodiana]